MDWKETATKVEAAARYWAGESASELAKVYDVSRNAVIGNAQRRKPAPGTGKGADAPIPRITRFKANGYSAADWTPAKLDVLRRDYGSRPNEDLAAQLRISPKALSSKASELGLTRPDTWTEAELAILKEHYPTGLSAEAMMAKLPGRGWQAIRTKALKAFGYTRPALLHSERLNATSGNRSAPGEGSKPPTFGKVEPIPEGYQPVTLFDLNHKRCKWPLNSGEDPEHGFLFCGEAQAKGRYCAHHAARAFTGIPAPPRKDERHQQTRRAA